MQVIAYALCSVVGYLAGLYLPEGLWGTYAPILISYHLFLGFLMITAEDQGGRSLPFFASTFTHLACIAVVVGLAMGGRTIPFFSILRFCLPAIAPFEAFWLFSGARRKRPAEPGLQNPNSRLLTASAEEYDEFVGLIRRGKRPYRKAGRSVIREFELWLGSRPRRRRSKGRKSPQS